MKIEVDVAGLKDALATITKLDKKTGGKILRTAVRDSAKIIKKQAQQNAPVGTGALKRTMRVRKFKTRNRQQVTVGVMTGKRVKLNIGEGSKYYYPAAIEYGSKKRNIQPSHFMRRALESKSAEAIQTMGSILWRGIRQGFAL